MTKPVVGFVLIFSALSWGQIFSTFAGTNVVSWDIPPSDTSASQGLPLAAVGLSATKLSIQIPPLVAGAASINSWQVTGWKTNSADLNFTSAIANTNYFQWSVSVAADYQLSLDGIGQLNVSRGTSGPGATNGQIGLFYSTNGFVSSTLAGTNSASISTVSAAPSSLTSLSEAWASSPVVINGGQTITFRLVCFGAIATNGTFRIVNNANPDIIFNGTVTRTNVSAKNLTWNGGASGTWNTTDTNWYEFNPSAPVAFSNGDSAIFPGGANISVPSPLNVGNISATNMPAGQTLSFTGSGSLNSFYPFKIDGSGIVQIGVPTSLKSIEMQGGQLVATVNNALSGALTAASEVEIGSTSHSIESASFAGPLTGTGVLTATIGDFSFNVNGTTLPTNEVAASLAGTSAGLIKNGAGALRLSGASSFGRNIFLNGGMLETASANILPDTAVVVFSSGTTLKLGGNETINSLSAASAAASSMVDLQSYNLTLTATASNQFQGMLVGSGSLTKQGTSILSINERNTFTGGTVLKSGSLRIQDSGIRSTNTDTGIVTLFSGPFGTGPLSLQGGKIYSSSTNSRSIYNAIDIAGDFTLGDTAATSNGEMNVSTNVTGATTTVSSNSTITVLSPTDWYQSISSGPGKILSKNGASYLRLRGANQIDTLQVLGGGLYVQNSNNLSSVIVGNTGILGWGYSNIVGPCNYFGNATLVLSNGATLGQYGSCGLTNDVVDRTLANSLRIQGDVTLGLGTYSSYLAGGIDLTGGSRTLALSNSTFCTGPLSNGTLELASSSATRFLVLAASNNFTGPLTLKGGILVLSNANALQGVSQIVFNGNTTNGGTLGLTTANTNDYSSLFSSGDLQNYRIDTGGANSALDTTLGSTNGSFYKSGLGTLTLPVANLFQGGATLAEGRLALGNNGSLGTGEFLIDQSGVEIETLTPLVLSNDVRLSGSPVIVGSHPLEITGTTRVSGANRALYPSNQGGVVLNRVELSTSPTNNAYRLAIYGTSPVVVNGSIVDGTNSTHTNGIPGCQFRMSNPSTVTFRGTNTYTGPTWIEAGTLRIETAQSFPANGNLQLNGGILRLNPPGTYQVGNLSGSIETNTVVLTNVVETNDVYTYPDGSVETFPYTITNVVTNITVQTNPISGTIDMGNQGAVLRVASMTNWITNSVLTFTNYQVSGSVAYVPTNLTTEQIASIKNAADPTATASVNSQGLLSFSGSGNTAPSIALGQTFSVPENSTSGTLVGQVVASDPDGNLLSGWTIVSGDPGGAFFINSSGEIRVAGIVNFELNSSYTLGVTVSDGTVTSAVGTVVVTVTNVVEYSDFFGTSSSTADDNRDGISNLMAYALGATSPSSVVVPPQLNTADPTKLTITALIRINDPKVSVVGVYGLAPGTWVPSSPIAGLPSSSQTGAVAGVTQRQDFSVLRGTDSKKFMYLKATQAP